MANTNPTDYKVIKLGEDLVSWDGKSGTLTIKQQRGIDDNGNNRTDGDPPSITKYIVNDQNNHLPFEFIKQLFLMMKKQKKTNLRIEL